MTEDPVLRLETDANVLAAIKRIRERGTRDTNLTALCDIAERHLAERACNETDFVIGSETSGVDRMGRPPIGTKAMSNAERARRFRSGLSKTPVPTKLERARMDIAELRKQVKRLDDRVRKLEEKKDA